MIIDMESVRNSTKKEVAIDIDKLKSLGNLERVRIMGILLDKGSLSWTELQKELKVNPNTLNFHLTKLLHNEFVIRKVIEDEKGHFTQYSLTEVGRKYYNSIKQMS